jgi:oxygen-independent coproporphyrinogen-3 oxidase
MQSPTPARPPWLWPRAAYVHVPFCAHHCGYCDFAIAVGRDDRMADYLAALRRELEQLETPAPVETLFIGGGTPTHLPEPLLEALLSMLGEWLPLSPGHEFSVEANPDDLDEGKISLLAARGVNRLSIGVQSFEPEVLGVLERRHSAGDVPRAVALAQRRIANVSLDLIFGVPGQTLPQWQRDLARALDLRPAHFSTYGLTYEKGTPLWKQRSGGEVVALDEQTELDFYTEAMQRLEAAGFEHYEISNFARPGQRCRHNEIYWANEAYWGFGVGAARYVGGVRSLNTRDLSTYLRRMQRDGTAVFQSESLEPRERAVETAVIQLRRSDGIDRAAFGQQTGFDFNELLGAKVSALVRQGVLDDDGACVRLTRRGKCVADAVVRELL